jgi:Endoplasmic Reticulum-Golgi Intermediate Compartment (ERGIC)
MSSVRWAANLDMYRKVPMDLLEGTKRGSILSYVAISVMIILFLLETRAYLESRYDFMQIHVALFKCF